MKTSQQTEKELILNKKNEYSVNAKYTQPRVGNYELRDRIKAKWENTDEIISGCGNCHSLFCFNIKKQSFEFREDYTSQYDTGIDLFRVMSPSLFLYRLICTFFGTPKCEDGYKSVWGYDLIHKNSGKGINFSEWKGAIGFWLPEYTPAKLTKEFKDDLIELMNYLVSNECAHPYDGLVAGSVA